MKRVTRENMISAGLVCFSLIFLIFLYTPMEIFFVNFYEFRFDIYVLLPILLVGFLILFIILYSLNLICGMKSNKVLGYIITIELGLLLYFYVQGNFLVADLPLIDGNNIDWKQYGLQKVLSVVVFLVAMISVFCIKKFMPKLIHKIIFYATIYILLMFALSITMLGIRQDGFMHKENGSIATDKDELKMSVNANYIIFILDTIDSVSFKKILDDSPKGTSLLQDFTYYPDTMGGYSTTSPSVPLIASGQWYEHEGAINDFSYKAYAESLIWNELRRQDYHMGIYASNQMNWDELNADNVENYQWNPIEMWMEWCKLTAYRYLPYQLKYILIGNTVDFDTLLLKGAENNIIVFNGSMGILHEKLKDESIVTTNDKCFKWIHLDGGHPPFIYDEKINVIPYSEGTYEKSLGACITFVDEYLSVLKENKVYDNSVIVLMADHGYEDGRQNPIFFVKGINEHHDFLVSDIAISYDDLQDGFLKLLAGIPGDQIFDKWKGIKRDRRFIDTVSDEKYIEYIQTGNAWNRDTMIPTGNEY